MLAERLLGKGGYECDRELRTLELLKVRFGEGALHGAEVMLKVGWLAWGGGVGRFGSLNERCLGQCLW